MPKRATRGGTLMGLVSIGMLAGFVHSGDGPTAASTEGGPDHQFKVSASPYEAELLADGDVTRRT